MRFSTFTLCAAALLAAPALSAQTLKIAEGPVRLDAMPSSERTGALLFEDFESTTAVNAIPTGWARANVNEDARQWNVNAVGGALDPTRASSGIRYAGVFWNDTQEADDWLFTPGVAMAAGVEHTVRFYFKPGDPGFGTSENFAVYAGTEQDPDQMGFLLFEVLDDPAVSPGRFITVTFTPTTSASYVIGFHCFSEPDQYFCAIDDVEIRAGAVSAEGGPAARASLLGSARPNPATGVARVTLTSETTQTISVGLYDALGRRVADVFDGAVAGGVDRTVDLRVADLPAGVYTIRAVGETLVSTQRLTVTR